MTIDLTTAEHLNPAEDLAPIVSLFGAPRLATEEDERVAEEVEVVAKALDRLHAITARIGPMTLRAEVCGQDPEVICAALDEIARTTERVLETWLEC